MFRHRRVARGLLSAATMVALGLWVFRGPMPDMVMHGALTMTTPSGVAMAHAAGPMPGHCAGTRSRCAITVGCCPGSSTPPPNPLLLRFDVVPAAVVPVPVAPPQPHLAAEHHWQPQPIGPPAPLPV
jgi:hypothetical protein